MTNTTSILSTIIILIDPETLYVLFTLLIDLNYVMNYNLPIKITYTLPIKFTYTLPILYLTYHCY